MNGMHTLGVKAMFDGSAFVAGANNAGASLRGVGTAANSASKSVNAMATSGTLNAMTMNQHFQHAIHGMMQLQSAAISVRDAFGGMMIESANAAEEFEMSMTRVAIVMGKTGDRADNPELIREYDMIEERINEIGRNTEFTIDNAAASFVKLKQAGLEVNDALGILDQTMAFSSASAGEVSLENAANVATTVKSTFGLTVDETNALMDSMTKLSTISKISMGEMEQVVSRYGSSATILTETTPEQFLAVSAMMRQLGIGAGESANNIKMFGRAVTKLHADIQSGANTNRVDAATALGIDSDDLLDEGKFRELPDLIERIVGSMRSKVDSGELREGDAVGFLERLLGRAQATNVVKLYRRYSDELGSASGQLVEDMRDSQGYAQDAQDAANETTEGLKTILAGSLNILAKTFGETLNELSKPIIEFFTNLSNELTLLIGNSETAKNILTALTTSLVLLSSAFAVLMGFLVTFGSLNMVLAPIMRQASTAGATISQTIGAMGKEMFQPIVKGFNLVKGGLVTLASVLAIFYVQFTENFLHIGDQVREWATVLTETFSVIGKAIRGEPIDAEVWDSMSERSQKFTRTLTGMWHRMTDFFGGIAAGLKTTLGILGMIFAPAVRILLFFVDVIFRALTAVGLLTGSSRVFGSTMKVIGGIIGSLIGLYMGLRTAIFLTTVVQAIFNGIMAIGPILMAAKKALNVYTIAIYVYDKAVKIVAAAQAVWNAVMAANPIGLLIVGVLVLIGVVYALARAFPSFGEALTEAWQGIKDAFVAAIPYLKALMHGFVFFFKMQINNIKFLLVGIPRFLWGIMKAVGLALLGIWELITTGSTDKFKEAGSALVNAFRDGVLKYLSDIKDDFKEMLGDIVGLFQFSPAKHGPLRDKPMEVAGANIVHNIKDGIGSNELQVRQSMEGVVRTIQSTMPGEGSMSIPAPTVGQPSVNRSGEPMQQPVTPMFRPDPVPPAGMNQSTQSSGGQSQPRPANVTVSFGDIQANVEKFDPEEAEGFIDQIIELLEEENFVTLRSNNVSV